MTAMGEKKGPWKFYTLGFTPSSYSNPRYRSLNIHIDNADREFGHLCLTQRYISPKHQVANYTKVLYSKQAHSTFCSRHQNRATPGYRFGEFRGTGLDPGELPPRSAYLIR